jgi:hypothetical protein
VIEVVSFPADLSAWDQDVEPFYLEIYGETSPIIDMTYAEVIPPGRHDAETSSATPIYEYWWTIGRGGHGETRHHVFLHRHKKVLWNGLKKKTARVYLYFPISGGWRVKELVATVKYLSPVQDQKRWSDKAAVEWQGLQPLLADAATLTSSLAPIPGVGTAAAGAAPMLSALSRMKVGSVPQGVKGFGWYVEKVTFGSSKHGLMQGVCWTLPATMLHLLGGRLTGSIALSFVPASRQSEESRAWEPTPASILAHASISPKGERPKWVPANNQFIELQVSPKTPAPALPQSAPHHSTQPDSPPNG